MADNYNDVVLNLLQAVDIISTDKVNSLPYDKTVVAEIVSTNNAKKGEYTVSDSSSEFLAYSENTEYSLGTKVYVTVPNGDWDNKKIIKGKYVSTDTEYYTYTSPLNDFLDITDNLVDKTPEGLIIDNTVRWGLPANGTGEGNVERIIWSSHVLAEGNLLNINQSQLDTFLNPSTNKLLQAGYSRLALSAEFSTKLRAYGTYAGNYGIRLYVYSYSSGESGADKKVKEHIFTLDCDNFFGDPYGFEASQRQSVLFDISQITDPIIAMRLTFFQDQDFLGNVGALIPDKRQTPNIFMVNPFVSLGHSIDNFTTETPLLYCLESMSYKSLEMASEEVNNRTLQIRWVHEQTAGSKDFYCIDEEREIPYYITSSGASGDTRATKAKIYLYRYSLSDRPSNEITSIAGPGWKLIHTFEYDKDSEGKISWLVSLDPQRDSEKFKTIIEYPTEQYRNDLIAQNAELVNLERKIVALQDDYNNSTMAAQDEVSPTLYYAAIGSSSTAKLTYEECATLITQLQKQYNDQYNKNIDPVQYYESEILEFINESEVANFVTLDLINGLNILCDTENYNGNFQCYRENNQLNNQSDAAQDRKLKAIFNSVRSGYTEFDGPAVVTWYFPVGLSMIQLPVEGIHYVLDSTMLTQRIGNTDEYATKRLLRENDNDSADSYWYEDFNTMVAAQPELEYLYANEVGYCEDTTKDYNGMFYIRRENVSITSKSNNIGNNVPTELQQLFRIQPVYSFMAINNTVWCTIERNSRVYEKSYTMSFGINGNNGTKYTFNLTLADDKIGWVYGQQNQILKVVPHLFDYKNKPVTIDKTKLRYTWYSRNTNTVTTDGVTRSTAGLELDNNITDLGEVNIRATGNAVDFTDFEFYILRADISQPAKKTASDTAIVTLTAYLPIIVTQSSTDDDYIYADSGWTISYNSNGTNPIYFKDPFVLWGRRKDTKAISSVTAADGFYWTIELGQDTTSATAQNKRQYFYPYFNRENILVPPSIKVQQTGVQIAARCTYSGNMCFSIPIMITQYGYESEMINAWDGNLSIDEKNNTIMSAMMGAGIKNADNSFSGVLMGDVQNKAAYEETGIGLYGFQSGEQSFGFKVDGTAFIGRSGYGRINFDGNKGTIKSSAYDTAHYGMCIDLDDGVIEIQGAGDRNTRGAQKTLYTYQTDNDGNILVDSTTGLPQWQTVTKYSSTYSGYDQSDPNAVLNHSTVRIAADNPYFKITSATKKTLIDVEDEQILIQTNDFSKGVSGVKINLLANSNDFTTGTSGGNVGSIEAYGNFNFLAKNTIENSQYKGSYVQFSSSGNPYLRIHYEDNQTYIPAQVENNNGKHGELRYSFETATSVNTAQYKTSGINMVPLAASDTVTEDNYTKYYKRVTHNVGSDIDADYQGFYYKLGISNNLLNFTTGTQSITSSNFVDGYSGTSLNLSTGTFKSYGNFVLRAFEAPKPKSDNGKTGFILSSGGSPFLQILNDGKTLLDVQKGKFIMQSPNYSTTSGSEAGVKIDLVAGTIDAYSLKIKSTIFNLDAENTNNNITTGIHIHSAGNPYLQLTYKNGSNAVVKLLDISTNNYKLQSINYAAGTQAQGFRNGKGTQIDLDSGAITSYGFNLKAYNIKTEDNVTFNRLIYINAGATTYPLAIHNNYTGTTGGTLDSAPFRVTWDGKLYATGQIHLNSDSSFDNTYLKDLNSGKVAGWSIVSNDNGANGYLAHSNNNGITHYLGTGQANNDFGNNKLPANLVGSTNGTVNNPTLLFKAGTKFAVAIDGTVYATGAVISGSDLQNGSIGGWTISSNALYHYGGSTISDQYATHYLGTGKNNNDFNSSYRLPASLVGSTNGTTNNPSLVFKAGTKFGVDNAGVLYATGAVISGQITATSGYIGGTTGWTIKSTYIYNGMTSLNDTTNNGVYIGTDGIALGKGTFKVTKAGALTATNATITGEITATSGSFTGTVNANDGKIGGDNGWTIESQILRNGTTNSTSDGAITLSTTDFTRNINGTSRSGLRLAIGKNFAVSKDGTVYAAALDSLTTSFNSISSTYATITSLNAAVGRINTIESKYITADAISATNINTIIGKIDVVKAKNISASGYLASAGAVTAGTHFSTSTEDGTDATIKIHSGSATPTLIKISGGIITSASTTYTVASTDYVDDKIDGVSAPTSMSGSFKYTTDSIYAYTQNNKNSALTYKTFVTAIGTSTGQSVSVSVS